MSAIKINNQALIDRLGQAAKAMTDTTPLTSAIASSFASVTDDNFESGGRPKWAGRKPTTIASYKRRGMRYGGVLQATGHLRSQIVTQFTRTEAAIGTNVPYAPTMHFGAKQGQFGKTRRNTPIPWGDIEPRPFLPMDENENLQPEAEREVFRDVDYYWQRIFD
uniref:phage virion morphogenesis protein n=1 Tax=uncultured Acinetobacter sp. TaxID=165433 RepID=UPI00260EC874|nr:phage virion morphogenesis protein [uncultured Acinetobacter sp.]